MCNIEIREKAKAAGVQLWKLAELLGITDSHFSRRLRHELKPEEKKKCLDFIESREKEAAGNE